jgi:hypothetical protein
VIHTSGVAILATNVRKDNDKKNLTEAGKGMHIKEAGNSDSPLQWRYARRAAFLLL